MSPPTKTISLGAACKMKTLVKRGGGGGFLKFDSTPNFGVFLSCLNYLVMKYDDVKYWGYNKQIQAFLVHLIQLQ